MKKIIILILLATFSFGLAACVGDAVMSADIVSASEPAILPVDEATTALNTQEDLEMTPSPIAVEYDQDDLDSSVNGSEMTSIQLQGDAISVGGTGAMVDGSIVTITSAGTYSISGTLNNGQIVVDTQDEETVVLVLDGADITSTTSAPIYVNNANKTVITLAEDSDNRVTDGAAYVFDDPAAEEPNAAIFSKDDLTINGNGSLTVNGNYNNGIASKDDLKITGGEITVTAVNDGIKGRDSIVIKDGVVTINAGGDGMQSNNDVDADRGYIFIEGGTIDITAGLDGFQAETRLVVSGGHISLLTGGGNGGTYDYGDSAKGLKAGLDISITDGTFSIDSMDDAIHSNGSITIDGGEFVLASGDDAIHSDTTLEINGGDLSITWSYEGLEGNIITINGGTIHLNASDDGINGTSSTDPVAMNGRPGPGDFGSGDSQLIVNGGYLFVDALGDGIDINGAIAMTDGLVIVNGPIANDNGPVDYLGEFNISGGFLVAVGSAGMAQAPSLTSTQYSVMQTFSSTQAASTLVHIETEDGQSVLTFMPTKEYQSVLISAPELENGSTYVVFSGGNSTGSSTDGLYVGGTYTAGTQVGSFTISSIVTGAGSSPGGFPGGPGGIRPPRP